MNPSHSSTSVCRRCRHYEPQGRRGGHCQQLDVVVQGGWTACALVIPPFTPAWESFEDIMLWQQKTLAAMQESVIAASLQDDLCSGAEALPSDRASVGSSINGAIPSRMVLPLSGAPGQTTGIKALWM